MCVLGARLISGVASLSRALLTCPAAGAAAAELASERRPHRKSVRVFRGRRRLLLHFSLSCVWRERERERERERQERGCVCFEGGRGGKVARLPKKERKRKKGARTGQDERCMGRRSDSRVSSSKHKWLSPSACGGRPARRLCLVSQSHTLIPGVCASRARRAAQGAHESLHLPSTSRALSTPYFLSHQRTRPPPSPPSWPPSRPPRAWPCPWTSWLASRPNLSPCPWRRTRQWPTWAWHRASR